MKNFSRLNSPVIHYDEERLPDDRPGSFDLVGEDSSSEFGEVWSKLNELFDQYNAKDRLYFLVDDRYNDERYQYIEVLEPEGLSAEWMNALMCMLDDYQQWGICICNIPYSYVIVFADKIMVNGPYFEVCKTVREVLEMGQEAMRIGHYPVDPLKYCWLVQASENDEEFEHFAARAKASLTSEPHTIFPCNCEPPCRKMSDYELEALMQRFLDWNGPKWGSGGNARR